MEEDKQRREDNIVKIKLKLQWLKHRWLVYSGWLELVLESLGNSSDNARKQTKQKNHE